MEKGKSALRNGDYQEASNRFDSALIEKPNDEDASALLKRSNISIESQRVENLINEFLNDTDVALSGISDLYEKYGETMPSIGIDEADINIPLSDNYYQKMADLKTKWADDDDMKVAFDSLYNASIELRSIFENISVDIQDPYYDDLTGKDPFEIIRHRNETNDSSVNAQIHFDEFQRNLSSYKEEIKRIKMLVVYNSDTE